MAEHPEQMLPQHADPPAVASKKCVPTLRSIHSSRKASDTAGMAKMLAALAVRVPQTRIGTRLIDMPGQRIRRKVTTKLIAPTVVEMPRSTIPRE